MIALRSAQGLTLGSLTRGALAALSLVTAIPQSSASERVLGDPDAPVEIREYSSLSCPHCASFHADILPALKEKYIDTGKAKLVFRDFPLNLQSWLASGVAHCAGQERFFPVLELLFAEQRNWAAAPATGESRERIEAGGLVDSWRAAGRSQEEIDSLYAVSGTVTALADLAKFAGVDEAETYACLGDFALLESVLESRQEGVEQYDVSATPTLVINGETFEGGRTVDAFSAVIDEALGG